VVFLKGGQLLGVEPRTPLVLCH